ncbi:MAG TPA: DNA gyrase inhibitor YacG [Steroidobacteraceae bacterium]|nr:DNA gyrase inhibitor YacG [Steroidobacteraceae bacterium]
MSTPKTHACPTCKRQIAWTTDFPWRPFCSERCKMVDLGAWLANDRAIPGDPADEIAPEASRGEDPPA